MPVIQPLQALGAVASAILALLTLGKLLLSPVTKQLAENRKDNMAIKTGINVMLRHELERECAKVSRKGYLTTEETQNITEIYDAYHALGGNGAGTAMYTRAMRLTDWKESEK